MTITLHPTDRAILQAYANGHRPEDIAAHHNLRVADVRDTLWALCRLQERLARAMLPEFPDPPPAEPPPDEADERPEMTATLDDELIAAGLTYRMLDYWSRKGHLRTTNPHPGSGGVRTWLRGERAVALTMARLARAGLPLDKAEAVARGQQEIGPGIRVVIDGPVAS